MASMAVSGRTASMTTHKTAVVMMVSTVFFGLSSGADVVSGVNSGARGNTGADSVAEADTGADSKKKNI